ncbi:MAG: polysialic acid transporter [Gammaproteobacteria bacterium HGW-Gammaproteobacteria-1]|jgi:protein involved in polysaccharide export with SLBB domain|nr:MAG: polysialic acid transporter [Gammaproteobacteria bacterium HGW-Gammaproteobacteria-1]
MRAATTSPRRGRTVGLLLLLAALLSPALHAAVSDPLSLSPRGLTESTPLTPPPPAPVAPPAVISEVFGAQIFSGAFMAEQFSGFNPDYQVAIGDHITLRMWGAFTYEATATVDPQGNIFIPNVGPVPVAGVRNAELNEQVANRIKRVYRSNVGVYVTLASAQPVKVYVTGYVHKPGLYGGLSSDSVLYYLDRAGGIDAERGSFLDISVLRSGETRARFNLYHFLLEGKIAPLQLHDGDTVVVGPRKHTVRIGGDVLNPYQFEFDKDRISARELLALAKPRPAATHLSIVRKVGTERRSEYHPLAEAGEVMIEDGDEVAVTADKYPGTILVRVEGAHLGEHVLVLPYGARLKDALARVKPAPQANNEAVQLFRKSVAQRQRDMLESTLRSLEAYVLTARSATSEEAALRTKEADLVLQFVDRARRVEPRGQILLGAKHEAQDALLEDGDIIRIPETSSLVLVHGEVLFANAIVFDRESSVADYIAQAGGYTQNADSSRVVVLHQDGSFSEGLDFVPQPGDEIMVLPRVDTKNIEVTRGITQILYQIAVAAKIVFGL